MSTQGADTRQFTAKYFSFLVTDFGFAQPTEKWASYEFHIKYLKDNIEIDIAIEADGTSIPWVSLIDHGRSSDLDMTLTSSNYYRIESLEDNATIRNINNSRNERYNPKVIRCVDEYSKTKNYEESHKELDDDYETFGRNELETLLSESAEIIKRHDQILSGDLSAFPKREQPREIKLDIYEQIGDETRIVKQQKFDSVGDFMKFVKDKSNKSTEELTSEELKKKAYLMGLRLKNSGLDAETIYARLEKQGIPEELARQVAQDTVIERKRQVIEDTQPVYNFALIRIGIGVIIALISYIVFPDIYILPIGIIAGGIVSALMARKKMEE